MTFSKNLSFCLLSLSLFSLSSLSHSFPWFVIFFTSQILSVSFLINSFFPTFFLFFFLYFQLSFVPFLLIFSAAFAAFLTYFLSFPLSTFLFSLFFLLPYLVSHQMVSTLNPNGEHNLAHIYFYLLLGGGGSGVGGALQRWVGMLGKKEG